MYLEFLLRNSRNRKTECAVFVPIAYWWQEGPKDTHIQFDRIGTANYHPKLNQNEDYIIPSPQDTEAISIAYHIGIIPSLPETENHHFIADETYIARLKALWN